MALFLLITSTAQFGSTVLGFTSNSRDMTLPGHPGVTFKSAAGLTPSNIEIGLDETVNLEMTGIYQSGSFVHSDVMAGKWNFAEIEVFCGCWDDGVASGGTDKRNYGELLWVRGNVGEIKDHQTSFVAEGRGLIARLTRTVNIVTSRFCRAPEFGDLVFCKKDLTGTVTISGTAYKIRQTGVSGIGSASGTDNSRAVLIFDTSAWSGNHPPPNSLFANGKVTATSGVNSGVSREIAGINEATGGYPYIRVELKRPFPFAQDLSAIFTLTAGCDHTREMCTLYDNIANRRAEDDVPGLETVNRVPPAN